MLPTDILARLALAAQRADEHFEGDVQPVDEDPAYWYTIAAAVMAAFAEVKP